MFTQRHVTNLFVSTQPFTHTRTVLAIKYTSACLFGCDSNSRTHLSPHLLLHATDRISPHDSSRLGSHPPLTKNRRIFQEFSKESRVSNLYPLEAALQLGTGAKVGALRPSSHYPTKPAIHEGGKKEKGWSRLQKKLYILYVQCTGITILPTYSDPAFEVGFQCLDPNPTANSSFSNVPRFDQLHEGGLRSATTRKHSVPSGQITKQRAHTHTSR